MKLSVKKGDTVMVISGKDKGKTGKILAVDSKTGRIYVEGINIVSKSKKPRSAQDKGGILKVEGKIEAEELNDAFLRIMRHDTLSRVKNRTALTEDLPQYFDKKIIVLIFDLDKFKFINDNYGHLAGDRVIQEYAKIFCEVFDEESVYRYGGDEFLVVRGATTEEQFNSEIENMRAAADNLEIEGIETKTDYSFGFSFGIVQNGTEFEELLVKADDMLYEQKRKKHRN